MCAVSLFKGTSSHWLNIQVHHFPRLVTHSSRRVRLLTVTLHSSLSLHPQSRSLVVSPSYLSNEDYIGSWLISAFDIDRTIRTVSRKSWDALIVTPPPSGGELDDVGGIPVTSYASQLIAFLRGIVFSQPPTPPKPAKYVHGVPETEERELVDEDEEGKRARLLAAAFDSLTWLIRS
jgi:hypothetical protein